MVDDADEMLLCSATKSEYFEVKPTMIYDDDDGTKVDKDENDKENDVGVNVNDIDAADDDDDIDENAISNSNNNVDADVEPEDLVEDGGGGSDSKISCYDLNGYISE